MILCAAVAVGFQSSGDLKSYVRKLNADTAKAYESKDSAFFDRLYAPDFESKNERGVKMRRKESLFVLRFQLNTIKFTDYKATTQSVKLEPGKGTVVTAATLIGLTTPRHGRPAEKIKIARKWSDVFEKRGSSWALISRTEMSAPVIQAVPLTLAKPIK